MSFRNTTEQFGAVSQCFHWLTAFCIFGLLLAGFFMVGMAFSETKLQIYGLHKSFGLVVLFLGVMRLIWRFMNTPVQSLPHHPKWEQFLAKTIHIVLYGTIIGMPLSGWLMSSAGEFPAKFFGLFSLPSIFVKNAMWFEIFRTVHELFSYVLIASVGLHIIGALKHDLVEKDQTMARMGAHRFIGFLGLIFLFLVMGLCLKTIYISQNIENPLHVLEDTSIISEPSSKVQKWVIDPKKSQIDFTFLQYGQKITGHFETWSGAIFFDPDDLAHSTVFIRISADSIKTGSEDRDGQARGTEWFSSTQYPDIIFKSQNFKSLGPNQYAVQGMLTIRGVTVPLHFPFSLLITAEKTKKIGVMMANLTLQRLDFGVGQGPWQATDAIDNPVALTLKVTAYTP